MSSPQHPTLNRGIVKQVLSGDTVIIRGQPKGGPPPERQLCLSGINARKLARRLVSNVDSSAETKDEPFAWEAREFLRKKLVGKEVVFTIEYKVPTSSREYGSIFLGKDTTGENMTEQLVAEGLVEVRKGNMIKITEEHQRLIEFEEAAKAAGIGIWSSGAVNHVRDIKWIVEASRQFVDSFHQRPVKAIVEHVRDGSTIRAFILPGFQYVTVMMSGIRCPMIRAGDDTFGQQQGEQFAGEAKYFTESRLLQRDVEIILESVSNANFLGSILHPCGNIAELLLKEGFAKCVDWSMPFVSCGMETLRAAEKFAKNKRLRIWKDYTPSVPQISANDRDYVATVVEIVNADSVVVKKKDGSVKKIFLASIRPPRVQDCKAPQLPTEQKGRQFRPIYDIPYMYEARELLRHKLIGKEVNVTVDYIQPPSDAFPEKICCTVTVDELNIAETLVSKGLATVVRYRQDDDMRSSQYDLLLAAESKAQKNNCGLHGKNKIPIHRISDVSGDSAKAKQFLPFLQRAGRSGAMVEYVGSGSRLRLYIPKETCLLTLVLGGISCPRASRPAPGGGNIDAEPFGEEALNFTKELCMQREVEVEVEGMDKVGNFIGWLWANNRNLSVALVEAGLASVHQTAERSAYFKALIAAEAVAKSLKLKIWTDFKENCDDESIDDDDDERVENRISVVVTEVCPDLRFYAQHCDEGPQLEALMNQLREEFSCRPPIAGIYCPKKNELCAARFVDGQWYRAKVEKVSQDEATVIYIDYGNKEVVKISNLAMLPETFHGISPAAHPYYLACVQNCSDSDFQREAVRAFSDETQNQSLLLNVEYRIGSREHVTVINPKTKEDIALSLIADGLLLLNPRKEQRLQMLVMDYKNMQEIAKKKRINVWEYGDFTEDDAKEFGFQRN